MKYIVSFTTSPKRIHQIFEMVHSLVNQTYDADLIILNIPKVFNRTSEIYDVPKSLRKLVHINVVERDYGPATKIVPTIAYLNENNYDKESTRIVYLDDDIVYPNVMLETIDSYVKINNDNVYSISGFNFINLNICGLRTDNRECSVAEGYGGVCVKLSMFKDDFTDYIDEMIKHKQCFLSDDVVLSNYYHKHDSPITIINKPGSYSFYDLWENKCILPYGNEDDALHLGAGGTSVINSQRYKEVLKIFKTHRYIPLYYNFNNKKYVSDGSAS